MSHPQRYEIEIRGRVHDRVLHPFVDDFSVSPTGRGTTRLVGEIRDPSHLHGVLAHLTSMNVEVIELRRIDSDDECVGSPSVHHTREERGTSS